MINTVGNVLLLISTVVGYELIWRYHRITRGAWRSTSMGVHAMSFVAALVFILTLFSARIVAVEWFNQDDPMWFQELRVAAYLLIPAIFLWRRHKIVQLHRNLEKEDVR